MFGRWRYLRLVAAALLRSLALAAGCAAAAAAAEPAPQAIDAVVRENFGTHPNAGFSLAIVHAGAIVYALGHGLRDLGTPDRFIAKDQNFYGQPFTRATAPRAPADSRTIYRIGSVTRQFTAAAILLLSERRQVDLDAPLSRYLPEFRDPSLTLRLLLVQRSGLPDSNALSFVQRVLPQVKRADGSIDAAALSTQIAALPPDFKPGMRFEYSTSNYVVLGRAVERVTGRPLGAFLQANIFTPLGMTRTGYAASAAADDVAIGYRIDEAGAVRRAYPWNLAWLGGAGAMTSTADDLARWDLALLERRVLQPASFAQFWHGLDAGRGQGSYAMGWIEDALGSHRYFWHNGEVGGFHALNVVFPDDDLAFTLLNNTQDARPEYFVPRIASLYFPVSGLDRILPHSAVLLVEVSLTIGLGALAIAVVAVVTLRRFVPGGIVAAVLALLVGFFAPSIAGFVWAGIGALLPTAAYILAAMFVPKKAVSESELRTTRSRR